MRVANGVVRVVIEDFTPSFKGALPFFTAECKTDMGRCSTFGRSPIDAFQNLERGFGEFLQCSIQLKKAQWSASIYHHIPSRKNYLVRYEGGQTPTFPDTKIIGKYSRTSLDAVTHDAELDAELRNIVLSEPPDDD